MTSKFGSYLGEWLHLLRLAVPIALITLANTSINFVDIYTAGQAGATTLGGLSAGFSLISVIQMVAMGLFSGLDPFIARAFGAHDHELLQRMLRVGLCLVLGLSLLMVPTYLGSGMLFSVIGTDPVLLPTTERYLIPAFLTLPLYFLAMMLQRFWNALRVVGIIFVIFLSANVINYVLNLAWGLGHWSHTPLGAEGIAWASFVARLWIFGCLLLLTWMQRRKFRLSFRKLLSDQFAALSQDLKQVLRIAIPLTVQATLEVSAFAIMTLLASRLGPLATSAHQICLTIASFTFHITLGMGHATGIRIGHYLGAQMPERIQPLGWMGLTSGLITMSLSGLILLVWPESILGFFTDDLGIVEAAKPLILACAIFQIADGWQATSAGIFRGLGWVRSLLTANMIGHYGISIPVALILCFALDLGVIGLWIGLASGLTVIALVLLGMWQRWSGQFNAKPLHHNSRPSY